MPSFGDGWRSTVAVVGGSVWVPVAAIGPWPFSGNGWRQAVVGSLIAIDLVSGP
ncbi:hypothetical protein [Amycolatopsis sp. lyj-84]|uniref:hypothetical protein n=1 Tax=Amycolatopsis sp. lyj-84 TaxID=2789284 RepID=UPI0039791C05